MHSLSSPESAIARLFLYRGNGENLRPLDEEFYKNLSPCLKMAAKLPSWLRQEFVDTRAKELARRLRESGVNTVCQEAGCPNINGCFRQRKVTFLILGDTCSRSCRFCNVKKPADWFPGPGEDSAEPKRVSDCVRALGLDYVVITSVTRDDLADGGAAVFAQTVKLIRKIKAGIKIELLIPDFQGKASSLLSVLEAGPDVVGHNLETVPRLYPEVRPQADYRLSLAVLRKIKECAPQVTVKSSLMLGMGEAPAEVIAAMRDLRDCGCGILTLGQYLAPSARHYPVKEFIAPGKFSDYRGIGERLGFQAVLSAPTARSSYQAEELYNA